MERDLGGRRVHGRQVRAARVLLGWSQEDLAAKAGISLPTVKRLEADPADVREKSVSAVVGALKAAGVLFLVPGMMVADANDRIAVHGGVALLPRA